MTKEIHNCTYIKSGEVVGCGNGIYQMKSIKYIDKKTEKSSFIGYDEFCNVILGWKLKGEMLTVREATSHLNKINIYLPYFLIFEYIQKMIYDNKMMKYSKKRYQVK